MEERDTNPNPQDDLNNNTDPAEGTASKDTQDEVSQESQDNDTAVTPADATPTSKPGFPLWPLLVGLGLLVLVGLIFLFSKGSGGSEQIAKVGDKELTKEQFDRWLQISARTATSAGPNAGKTVVPDPPKFEKCIASKRETISKQDLPKGQKAPTAKQLKESCDAEYKALRQQTMQFLISASWIEGEASERGLEVTDKEVEKQFAQQRKSNFPKKADYEKFLKTTGQTPEDLKYRIKLDIQANKLRNSLVKNSGKNISETDVRNYFNKNRKQFDQPARRDIQVVITKNQSQAQAALRELRGGKGFASVVKKYSTDQVTKAQGGKVPGLAKGQGQFDPALESAAFEARKGQLVGPVKTNQGFAVLEVTQIYPAKKATYATAKEQVRNLIKSQKDQKVLEAFVKNFRVKWVSRTICEKGYEVADCKNAPKAPGGNNPPPPPQPQQGDRPSRSQNR